MSPIVALVLLCILTGTGMARQFTYLLVHQSKLETEPGQLCKWSSDSLIHYSAGTCGISLGSVWQVDFEIASFCTPFCTQHSVVNIKMVIDVLQLSVPFAPLFLVTTFYQ